MVLGLEFGEYLRLFKEFDIPITIFAVGLAIARNRELADYIAEHDYDICAHGFRWIDYQFVEESVEREHMQGLHSNYDRIFR